MTLTSINLAGRFAVTLENEVIPILKMWDRFGDETDNPGEVCVFIAGTRTEIHSFPVAAFHPATLN